MRRLQPRVGHALIAVLLALVLVPPDSTGAEETRRHGLGQGSPWQTSYWVRSAPAEGPTVMIVAGVHGDEPAGACAAEQIRHWPIRKGRLVVLPRANVRALAARTRLTPGVPEAESNLNRNYPDATAKEGDAARPRGGLAKAIWALLETYEPAWLLDLHEGRAPHRADPKHFGRTVIAHPDQPEALAVADRMVAVVNETVPDEASRFVRLVQVTRTTLARSAADHHGIRTLTVETCYGEGPLSRRARRHRLMVRALLLHLGMVGEDLSVEQVLPERGPSERIRVALYDAEGTGGPGVGRVLAQLGRAPDVTVVRLCPEDVRGGGLAAFDVGVFTGGSGSRQARALQASGREVIRAFVEQGGGYIGICAGAYLATAAYSWSVPLLDAKPVSNRWRRGRGLVEIEWSDLGRRIFGGSRGRLRIRYGNGPPTCPSCS